MGWRKKIAAVLGTVAVAAVGFCIYIKAGTDTKAPEITFGEELTLVTDDTTKEMLLADVKAMDDQDGDVSGQVIVGEQTVNDGFMEIVYIVTDRAGNVASKIRVVPFDGTADDSGSNISADDPMEEETSEETEETAEEGAETASEEETESGTVPVITMQQSSVTLPVGTSFEYSIYIASITDDADTREELYRNLSINGHYDINTPGSYQLEFWVVDKDGNQSERQPFTLIIE